MDLTLATNLLAGALQVVSGVLLGLPAFFMARRRQWWFSAITAPIALIASTHVGGIVLAVPCAVVVTVLFYVISALRDRRRRWASIVHLILGGLIILWTFSQIMHLPIRFYLEHSSARIAGNIAGIALGIALSGAFLESLMKRPLAGLDSSSDQTV